jgi:hypothetical protein
MAGAQKTYLFHIYRQDGSSLFLHPFTAPEKVVGLLEKGPLEGRYGREPQVESLTGFRGELYRQVEVGVRKWIDDARFVPKFLLAAAAFVFTYLFFSIVVRDPLPVIDEVVLGVAAAVITFVILGRRYLASRPAAKKRLDLRLVVDRVAFRESPFVKQVESALAGLETEPVAEVVRRIVAPVQQELGEACREEANQFINLLEGRFDLKKLERQERAFKRLASGRRDIARFLKSRQVDFALYAVYKSFKRTVAGLK